MYHELNRASPIPDPPCQSDACRFCDEVQLAPDGTLSRTVRAIDVDYGHAWYRFAFEFVDEYEQPYCDWSGDWLIQVCQSNPYQRLCSGSWPSASLAIAEMDIDAYGFTDNRKCPPGMGCDEDAEEEESPGLYIGLNDDFDEGKEEADLDDVSPVSLTAQLKSDDFEPIYLQHWQYDTDEIESEICVPSGKARVYLLHSNPSSCGQSEDPDCWEEYAAGEPLPFDRVDMYTYYVEGIDPGEDFIEFKGEILETGSQMTDRIKVTVVQVDIDVTRPAASDGGTVPDKLESRQGAVTKVLNPNIGIYTEDSPGTKELLDDPAEPNPDWSLRLYFDLTPSVPNATFIMSRVYIDRPINHTYEVVRVFDGDTLLQFENDMIEFTTLPSDLRVDFTEGGIVDFEIVAYLDGVELHRDRVRTIGIACPPKNGRNLFVNPSSTDPTEATIIPYNDYEKTAAHAIAEALSVAEDGDNVICRAGVLYAEQELQIDDSICLAGLGMSWILNSDEKWKYDPAGFENGVAYRPDYASLPSLTGELLRRILSINAADVTVAGFRFMEGLTDYGMEGNDGANIHADGGNGSLRFYAVESGWAKAPEGEGAGLYCRNVYDLQIEDCVFRSNNAESGAGIALKNVADVTVRRVELIGNTAQKVGTAHNLVLGGGILVDNCGGLVCLGRCYLTENLCSDLYPNPDNGIEDPDPEVPGVTVTEIDIGAYGGGIAFHHGDPAVFISKSLLYENAASSFTRRARGGAIMIRGIAAVSQCDACDFRYNSCDAITRASGGALDLFGASATVDRCKFDDNWVKSTFVGGDLPAPGEPVNSYLPPRIDYGGAVGVHHGGHTEGTEAMLTVNYTRFDTNTAWSCGGAIGVVGETEAITGEGSAAFEQSRQWVNLDHCELFSNKAGFYGGAIAGAGNHSRFYAVDCDMWRNLTLEKANQDSDGGALAWQVAGSPGIESLGILGGTGGSECLRCDFVSNEAQDGGGAVKHGGASTSVYTSCQFISNNTIGSTYPLANGEGGAVRASTCAYMTFEDCQFEGNHAGYYDLTGHGGAISVSNSQLKLLGPVRIAGNDGVRLGGGIYAVVEDPGYPEVVFVMETVRKPYIELKGGSAPEEAIAISGNTAMDGGGVVTVHGFAGISEGMGWPRR